MIDLNWWVNLEPQWQNALGETFFKHFNKPEPAELNSLFNSPVLRLAGPTAPYPNMSFELTNLSGIISLTNLNILVCTHHQLKKIEEVAKLTHLKSLFLLFNKIENLSGIENLIKLEQLYLQFNALTSIKAIEKLTGLKELYVNNNKIASFDGLTEAHADNLENFFCWPNEGLKQKEIIRVERELGIICRRT